jgi:hypothetical protein
MSQREWGYQIKLFEPLLEKRGSVTTKENNASIKRPRKKKERPPKLIVNVNQLKVDRHRVDIEHLQSSTQACATDEARELDHPTTQLLENR